MSTRIHALPLIKKEAAGGLYLALDGKHHKTYRITLNDVVDLATTTVVAGDNVTVTQSGNEYTINAAAAESAEPFDDGPLWAEINALKKQNASRNVSRITKKISVI